MARSNWIPSAALLVCCGASSSGAPAQSSPSATPGPAAAHFAAPVRVLADGAFAGATRRYPSPVLQDIDGDGLRDLVLGDLTGRVTVSLRRAGGGAPSWGPETPLPASDGTELKFSNW